MYHQFEIPYAVCLFQTSEMDVFKTRVLCRVCIARSYGTQQEASGAGVFQTQADDDSKTQEEKEMTGIGLEIKVLDYTVALVPISDVYGGDCPSQFVPPYPYPAIIKLAPYSPATLSGDEETRNLFVWIQNH